MTSKPVLIDGYCGAGGATRGYQRAGFYVIGVDIKAQPNYCTNSSPQADFLTFPLEGAQAVHASPPCQAFTHARHLGNRGRSDHPRLIGATRELLVASGLPYVIENVEDAKAELVSPVMLCGSMFGLDLERHRLFECSFPLLVPQCMHGLYGPARFPGTPRSNGTRPLSRVVNQMASGCTHEDFALAMGIDWIPARGVRPTNELREAIPPDYTAWLGERLLEVVRQGVR